MEKWFWLGLAVVCGAAGLSPWLFAIIGSWRRKAVYARHETRGPGAPGAFRVRYASTARFRKWLKMFPWEGCGILRVSEDKASFSGEFGSGHAVQLAFGREESTVEFAGVDFLHNGLPSWIRIRTGGEEHYFTPETGISVFGGKPKAHDLHEHLRKALG